MSCGTGIEHSGREGASNTNPALTITMRMHRMAKLATKACCHCGEEKPTTEFHKNRLAKDGLRAQCKPCTRAINRASVLRHHEKRKAEKRAEYQRKKDTPEYQAYVKAYQAATKDEKREYDKEYRAKQDPAKLTRRAADWNRTNKERRAAIVRSYDARRRAWKSGGISGPVLANWTQGQKKVCYWCGAKCADSFHVDHYTPLSRGGEHEISNLVISCGPCNFKKNAKDPLDFAREVGRLM